ncbi:MAG: signal peptidase Serine peptidase family [Nocardioides sp.]|nr:signal peptidase Serine peptidase family [Nocardioides sp.]
MTSEDRDHTSLVDIDETGSRSSRSTTTSTATPRAHLPVWQETLLLLGVALVLAIVVKALFVQAFYIPSESMEPGLVKNDRILVEKTSYWFGGTPQRGDVVVFEDPGGWLTPDEVAGPANPVTKVLSRVGLYPAGGHLVKRVIGVAGDTITCCDARGRISVNGTPLNEKSYARLDGADCYGPMTSTCDWTSGPVPAGHVFVMGDNRHHSADSTVHMCRSDETDCVPGDEFVPTDLMVGKVFVLVWPRDHVRWVQRPATFAAVPDAS